MTSAATTTGATSASDPTPRAVGRLRATTAVTARTRSRAGRDLARPAHHGRRHQVRARGRLRRSRRGRARTPLPGAADLQSFELAQRHVRGLPRRRAGGRGPPERVPARRRCSPASTARPGCCSATTTIHRRAPTGGARPGSRSWSATPAPRPAGPAPSAPSDARSRSASASSPTRPLRAMSGSRAADGRDPPAGWDPGRDWQQADLFGALDQPWLRPSACPPGPPPRRVLTRPAPTRRGQREGRDPTAHGRGRASGS